MYESWKSVKPQTSLLLRDLKLFTNITFLVFIYTYIHTNTHICIHTNNHTYTCANSFCCLLSQNGFLWRDHIKCVWEGAASTVSLCHMRRWMRETPLRAGECIRKGEKKILGWGVYQPCFFSLGIWAFDMLRMERWPAIKRQTAECHGNYCGAPWSIAPVSRV